MAGLESWEREALKWQPGRVNQLKVEGVVRVLSSARNAAGNAEGPLRRRHGNLAAGDCGATSTTIDIGALECERVLLLDATAATVTVFL